MMMSRVAVVLLVWCCAVTRGSPSQGETGIQRKNRSTLLPERANDLERKKRSGDDVTIERLKPKFRDSLRNFDFSDETDASGSLERFRNNLVRNRFTSDERSLFFKDILNESHESFNSDEANFFRSNSEENTSDENKTDEDEDENNRTDEDTNEVFSDEQSSQSREDESDERLRNFLTQSNSFTPSKDAEKRFRSLFRDDDRSISSRESDEKLQCLPVTQTVVSRVLVPTVTRVTRDRLVPTTVVSTATRMLTATIIHRVTDTDFRTLVNTVTKTRLLTETQTKRSTRTTTVSQFHTAIRTQRVTQTDTRRVSVYRTTTQTQTQTEHRFYTEQVQVPVYTTVHHTQLQSITSYITQQVPVYTTVLSREVHRKYVTVTATPACGYDNGW